MRLGFAILIPTLASGVLLGLSLHSHVFRGEASLTTRSHRLILKFYSGEISAFLSTDDWSKDKFGVAYRREGKTTSSDVLENLIEAVGTARPAPQRWLGFCAWRWRLGNESMDFYIVPQWFILSTGVLLLLPVASRLMIRHRRSAAGRCTKCRYDLRATPDAPGPALNRCPECGGEVKRSTR